MKFTRKSAAVVSVSIIAFFAFFFLVPVVPALLVAYIPSGNGYTSVSFHFFNVGEINLNGNFEFWTHGPELNCI